MMGYVPDRRTWPAAPKREDNGDRTGKNRDLKRRFAQVEGYLYRDDDSGQPDLGGAGRSPVESTSIHRTEPSDRIVPSRDEIERHQFQVDEPRDRTGERVRRIE